MFFPIHRTHWCELYLFVVKSKRALYVQFRGLKYLFTCENFYVTVTCMYSIRNTAFFYSLIHVHTFMGMLSDAHRPRNTFKNWCNTLTGSTISLEQLKTQHKRRQRRTYYSLHTFVSWVFLYFFFFCVDLRGMCASYYFILCILLFYIFFTSFLNQSDSQP